MTKNGKLGGVLDLRQSFCSVSCGHNIREIFGVVAQDTVSIPNLKAQTVRIYAMRLKNKARKSEKLGWMRCRRSKRVGDVQVSLCWRKANMANRRCKRDQSIKRHVTATTTPTKRFTNRKNASVGRGGRSSAETMKRTSSSLQLMTIDSTPSTSSEDDIESDAETRKADPSHKETSRGAVSIDKPAVFERKYCSPRMKMLTKGVGQGPRTSDLQAVVKVWRRGENGMKTMTRKQQKQQVEIDPFTATCSACSRPINGSVFMFQDNPFCSNSCRGRAFQACSNRGLLPSNLGLHPIPLHLKNEKTTPNWRQNRSRGARGAEAKRVILPPRGLKARKEFYARTIARNMRNPVVRTKIS
eukprot:jgi/Bigna1/86547/estExt_fgenesh1_pg.C_110174